MISAATSPGNFASRGAIEASGKHLPPLRVHRHRQGRIVPRGSARDGFERIDADNRTADRVAHHFGRRHAHAQPGKRARTNGCRDQARRRRSANPLPPTGHARRGPATGHCAGVSGRPRSSRTRPSIRAETLPAIPVVSQARIRMLKSRKGRERSWGKHLAAGVATYPRLVRPGYLTESQTLYSPRDATCGQAPTRLDLKKSRL